MVPCIMFDSYICSRCVADLEYTQGSDHANMLVNAGTRVLDARRRLDVRKAKRELYEAEDELDEVLQSVINNRGRGDSRPRSKPDLDTSVYTKVIDGHCDDDDDEY